MASFILKGFFTNDGIDRLRNGNQRRRHRSDQKLIEWKDDIDLKNDLAKFVRVNIRRLEILDFMRTDYPVYA